MKLAATLAILVLAFPALAADLSGRWKASVEGPDGQTMEITFTFKVDGDRFTGTALGPMGEMPISDGKLDGDAISFTVGGDDFKVFHKGKVSGDEMKLKVEMGERTFEMTAKRVKS
jgi:hypothetical protein